MANRIAGNVVIIDSAAGNRFALVDVSGGNQITKFYVTAIAVWGVDSTTAILLTGANTAQDIFFIHDYPAGATNVVSNPRWFPFAVPQRLETIKAPIVTAGTAFLYLV